MKLRIESGEGSKAAVPDTDSMVINNVQDILDMMADAGQNRADKLILEENHLHPSFFDLSSGLAGDILQKFSNYGMKLDILGDFRQFESNALKDFIRECNRGGHIRFIQK